ncbi:MAG: divalent metal cation transporter [Alphaproteobacteria bacterium]|nr:divalent metal cation transporter [Alphaproteobacteria bacterium]
MTSRQPRRRVRTPPPGVSWTKRLGPGLITGAADDDPSGVATYSQAGAQFGPNLLWTVILCYPLMVAVQLISARIGRVTGAGLAANMGRVLPKAVVGVLVGLLFVANTINIGADVGAMGAAANLVSGWNAKLLTVVFTVASLLLQLFVPYHRYVHLLKWLTLALFAYVGVIFTVHIDWAEVLTRTFIPRLHLSAAALTTIVAVFGTTISPYLFFWQSSEEVEDLEASGEHDLRHSTRAQAKRELERIRWDTVVGMAFSEIIAFFIILTTAVTLHAAGKTDIQSSEQAALALKPIAGPLAFFFFSSGIIGAGLLAVPVLAGSSAYAISEAFEWKRGLEHEPWEAPGFYAVIVGAMVLALGVIFSPLDPIKTLFWSAVVNGVIAVPIMAGMMIVGSRPREMGRYVASHTLRGLGWAATAIMAAAAIAMFVAGPGS